MRRLEVEYASPSCALVRGYGARELITEVTGRAPVYATLSRAWVSQPSTAIDVIALAETRGYLVLTTGRHQLVPTSQRDAARGDRRGIVSVGGEPAQCGDSTGRPARASSSSDGLW